MDTEMRAIFEQVTRRCDLTRVQAELAFDRIMSGGLSESAMAGLLGALATKGECVEELVGAAMVMRARASRIRCDADCIDTCGTGGDGISTFNVSTTAAIVAAAAGATVAKHGNQSTTRVSGSTEVLDRLGIDVDADVSTVQRSLAEVRIGYLNARRLHPAMRYAASVRRAIPVRTIFNLLGPLTNPAGARRQVIGVPRLELMDKIALAAQQLGGVYVWVVHGEDGLCDLSATSRATVVEVHDQAMTRFQVSPEEVGLRRCRLAELLVDSPRASAEVIVKILRGEPGGPRDHTLMNAGAALVVAGLAPELKDGVTRAAQAIDSGDAWETLIQWRAVAGSASAST